MAHTCPVWVGYLLLCPLRRFAHNPQKILGPHVRAGMAVLDVGCAMGFLSLPMARMVGPAGRVVCVDLQERMLLKLEARAEKAGLANRVQARLCTPDGLGLADLPESIDFAVAFMMVHEVPDPARLFAEIAGTLKPGAPLLLVEPIIHVPRGAFEEEIAAAERAGLSSVHCPSVPHSRVALLRKGPP